jgi:hypothetical protein
VTSACKLWIAVVSLVICAQLAQRRLIPFDRSHPIRQILVHYSQQEMYGREAAQLAVADSFVGFAAA